MTREGYGLFRLGSRTVSAHRLSYEIHKGAPGNQQVRHTCDNPPCVNPEHLLLGNAKANSDDKMLKDRHNFSLSNEQITDIRSRPVNITMCRDLAQEFGVTASQIKNILTGKTYGWLPGAKEIPPQFSGYKLTPQDIEEIQEELKHSKWGTQTRLAKKYGVTRGQISHINNMRLKYLGTDTL